MWRVTRHFNLNFAKTSKFWPNDVKFAKWANPRGKHLL